MPLNVLHAKTILVRLMQFSYMYTYDVCIVCSYVLTVQSTRKFTLARELNVEYLHGEGYVYFECLIRLSLERHTHIVVCLLLLALLANV